MKKYIKTIDDISHWPLSDNNITEYLWDELNELYPEHRQEGADGKVYNLKAALKLKKVVWYYVELLAKQNNLI